jgi:hypothetical protein
MAQSVGDGMELAAVVALGRVIWIVGEIGHIADIRA